MKAKLIKVDSYYIDGEFKGKPVVFVEFDEFYFGGCHVYQESLIDDCLSVEPYELSGGVYKCKFDGGKSGGGCVSKEWFDKENNVSST